MRERSRYLLGSGVVEESHSNQGREDGHRQTEEMGLFWVKCGEEISDEESE